MHSRLVLKLIKIPSDGDLIRSKDRCGSFLLRRFNEKRAGKTRKSYTEWCSSVKRNAQAKLSNCLVPVDKFFSLGNLFVGDNFITIESRKRRPSVNGLTFVANDHYVVLTMFLCTYKTKYIIYIFIHFKLFIFTEKNMDL